MIYDLLANYYDCLVDAKVGNLASNREAYKNVSYEVVFDDDGNCEIDLMRGVGAPRPNGKGIVKVVSVFMPQSKYGAHNTFCRIVDGIPVIMGDVKSKPKPPYRSSYFYMYTSWLNGNAKQMGNFARFVATHNHIPSNLSRMEAFKKCLVNLPKMDFSKIPKIFKDGGVIFRYKGDSVAMHDHPDVRNWVLGRIDEENAAMQETWDTDVVDGVTEYYPTQHPKLLGVIPKGGAIHTYNQNSFKQYGGLSRVSSVIADKYASALMYLAADKRVEWRGGNIATVVFGIDAADRVAEYAINSGNYFSQLLAEAVDQDDSEDVDDVEEDEDDENEDDLAIDDQAFRHIYSSDAQDYADQYIKEVAAGLDPVWDPKYGDGNVYFLTLQVNGGRLRVLSLYINDVNHIVKNISAYNKKFPLTRGYNRDIVAATAPVNVAGKKANDLFAKDVVIRRYLDLSRYQGADLPDMVARMMVSRYGVEYNTIDSNRIIATRNEYLKAWLDQINMKTEIGKNMACMTKLLDEFRRAKKNGDKLPSNAAIAKGTIEQFMIAFGERWNLACQILTAEGRMDIVHTFNNRLAPYSSALAEDVGDNVKRKLTTAEQAQFWINFITKNN